jgi:putative ABC transport system permease protein
VQVVAGNTNWGTRAFGTTNEYFEIRDWPLAAGRHFELDEMEGAAKVAIIGQTVAQQLFGEADPIDQVIRLNRVPVTIVGLLGKKGLSAAGHDQDDAVVVPINTFRSRVQGTGGGRLKQVHSVGVKVREGHSMKEAQESVKALLRQRLGGQPGAEDPFYIRDLTEILQAQQESSRVMAVLLATVAGISLVMGGVGVMNIMLVSVTERTREIGLRMAVGARGRDILSQFLVEAVTLSVIGGAIGVLVGAVATWAVGYFAGWQVSMTAASILLAAGFSACVGVFFGFYPARRASKLLPIEALRHE